MNHKHMPLKAIIFASLGIIYQQLAYSSTEECLQSPDFFKYLSGKIENISKDSIFYYALPCDTMVISKGVTVLISENVNLHFSDPNPNNLIVIEGKLFAKGRSKSPVVISSNIGQTEHKEWKGFQVGSEGSLSFSHVNMYGTETPIISTTYEINIDSSLFENSLGFKLPDFNYYSIKNSYVEFFNAKQYITEMKNSNKIDEGEKYKSRSIWKSPFLYTAIGLTTVGGTFAYLYSTRETKIVTKEEKGNSIVLPEN